MLFQPQNIIFGEGGFSVPSKVTATAHPALGTDIIKEFWKNFTLGVSSLAVEATDALLFSVGNVDPLPLDGSAYSLRITENGICLLAKDERSLLCGFMMLLDRFRAVDTESGTAIEADTCEIWESPLIETRMVHLCIFPETKLWELERFVRFCGALRYTHIVLEFWGMLQYDCMRELGWSHAFSKDEIRPIIRMATDLGLEVIPMFNHWGHASAGRVMHGKHVVLDQNPLLQTYFTEDGWCWDIQKPKVRALMRSIRAELMELCGKGEFFHIGCDEAYNFDFTEESMNAICDYINEISEELKSCGRRAIAWGDMFLHLYPHYDAKSRYFAFSPTPETERYMQERLSKDVLIADWQYYAKVTPAETTQNLKNAGFDSLFCPWDEGHATADVAISTVKELSLSGVLHTTWHTLTSGMSYVTRIALGCFEPIESYADRELRTPTAALLRRVMPSGGDYERAGWSHQQIYSRW